MKRLTFGLVLMLFIIGCGGQSAEPDPPVPPTSAANTDAIAIATVPPTAVPEPTNEEPTPVPPTPVLEPTSEPETEKDTPEPIEEEETDPLAIGEVVYADNCAVCHGANLEGGVVDGVEMPSHLDDGHTWHHSDEYLLAVIGNGGRIPGQMPAYKDILTQDEMVAVLDYIKSFWSEGVAAQQARLNEPEPTAVPDFTSPDYAGLGDPEAPITLIEYTDFQCPFCQRHHLQTLPTLISDYIETGRVYYVMRDFPIATLHPFAHLLHEAINCAGMSGGQDTFWQAHDLFFDEVETFKQERRPDMVTTILEEFAANGLPDVTDCMANGDAKEIVETNLALGSRAGVTGTPSFTMNGNLIVGAQSLQVFINYIDLAENGELQAAFEPTPLPDIPVPQPLEFSIRADMALGDPNAPATIIEFSDYQCPFCRRHVLETVPQLKELIDAGRLYYVFKDYPLPSLHPLAHRLHEATLCVRDDIGVDGFWQAHDHFFETVETYQLSDETAMEAAIIAGLDGLGLLSDAVQTCIVERTTADEVQASFAEGQKAGLNSTPYFIVNGYPVIRGAQPYDNFEYVVELAEEEGALENAIMEATRRNQDAQAQQAAAQATAEAQAAIPKDVPISGSEPAKGSADAPITIVEYSSYQCPFCKRHFDDTMPRLATYINNGTVRYIFKDYPLPSQPQAFKVHEATRCAQEQGGDDLYWAAHDLAFTEQATWARQPMGAHIDTIKELFHTLAGIDAAAFDTCLDSDRYVTQVQAEFDEGATLGVRGTPAFFINGQFISGAQPYSVFQQVIESQLADQ